MREIKFRTWDNNKMYYPKVAEIGVSFVSGKTSIAFPLDGGGYCTTAYVMQYTGLKDKNGKEIYEGDITSNGIVTWYSNLNWDSGGSEHPGFYFKNKYQNEDLDYHTSFDEDIEVIGNIYENPELIKEED